MSDDYSNDSSTDFDSLFRETPSEPPMTEQKIRAIASDQHLRDLAAMQQAAAVVGQRRAEALERAEQRHPGFQRLYNNPAVTDQYKQERPRSAYWTGVAEAAGEAADIDEFYDSFFNEAIQYESNPPQQQQPGRAVKLAPGGPFSLAAINRLAPEQRRPVIEALKNRVGDLPLDLADSTEESLKNA